MPYNYLIDKKLRRGMNLDLKNSIVIIDEAHNICSAAESAESIEINAFTLAQAEYELQDVIVHL